MNDFIERTALVNYLLQKRTASGNNYSVEDAIKDINDFGKNGNVVPGAKLPKEFEILKNIRDYGGWEFKHYPMSKQEAETIENCMMELKQYRDSGLTAEQLAQVDEEYLKVVQKVPRWRKCSEELPEATFGCLAIVVDTEPTTMEDFENLLPYFIGYDKDSGTWNDSDGEQCPFEVIKWMPLPEWEVEE